MQHPANLKKPSVKNSCRRKYYQKFGKKRGYNKVPGNRTKVR